MYMRIIQRAIGERGFAFLNGHLEEEVYMSPQGLKPSLVIGFKLQKSLYGLKQSPSV